MNAGVRSCGVGHQHSVEGECWIPNIGSVAAVSLVVDVFNQEERLTAPVDVAKMLDAMAIVIPQRKARLFADHRHGIR